MSDKIHEQKIALAQVISGQIFTPVQKELCLGSSHDFGFTFFGQKESATATCIACALTEAYWKPNSKYLVISTNTTVRDQCGQMLTNFSQIRPERTYKLLTDSARIIFGSSQSEVKFVANSSWHTDNTLDGLFVDLPYTSITAKFIGQCIGRLEPLGRLVIAAGEVEDAHSKRRSDSRLDQAIES